MTQGSILGSTSILLFVENWHKGIFVTENIIWRLFALNINIKLLCELLLKFIIDYILYFDVYPSLRNINFCHHGFDTK